PSAAGRRADPRYTNTATSTARTTAAKRVAASREAPRREVRSDGIVRKRGSAERRAETLPQLSGRPAREQSEGSDRKMHYCRSNKGARMRELLYTHSGRVAVDSRHGQGTFGWQRYGDAAAIPNARSTSALRGGGRCQPAETGR